MAEKVTIGNAELWHGDCRDVLPLLHGIDAIVSDPPYGIAFKHGGGGRGIYSMGNARTHHEPIIGDNVPFDPTLLLQWPCVLFGADHYAAALPPGGMMHVWDKDPKGALEFDSFSDAELFWTSWTQKRVVVRYLWKGLCQPINERRWHPTMKPVRVMGKAIELAKKAHVICDPYMGSGTTGVACMRLGRRFIGIEIDRRYFDIACERIDREQRQARLAV